MKRRDFLKVGGVGLAASAVAAPAIAQSMPEIKWRLCRELAEGARYALWRLRIFLQARRRRSPTTNSRSSRLRPAKSCPGLQVLDAVSNGTVEMGNTALYYYWGKNPAFTFGTALPFGLNTRQHISWLLWGGGQELLNDLLKEYNATAFRPASTGAQMGGWFRKEIKSMEDLKGLKFRVGGFAGTIIAKVGGVPQQIAGGDIYPALEKGTIDAAEWVGPYDDEKLGFVKVAKYYYYPGWWEGTGQGHNVMNLEKWNQLPKHYQAAVETASRDTFTWVTGKYDYVNPPALKRLLVAGAILQAVPAGSAGGLLQRRQRDLCGPLKDQPAFQQDVFEPDRVPERVAGLEPGRRALLRQLHDADAHAHLTRAKRKEAPETSPGLLLFSSQGSSPAIAA